MRELGGGANDGGPIPIRLAVGQRQQTNDTGRGQWYQGTRRVRFRDRGRHREGEGRGFPEVVLMVCLLFAVAVATAGPGGSRRAQLALFRCPPPVHALG